MIYLIYGAPGSGKTYFAVKHLEEWSQNRAIYTNIKGLLLPHLPLPEDQGRSWLDIKAPSFFVYDEAQYIFPGFSLNKSNNLPDPVLRLSTHRHLGHDFVFITQHPSLIAVYIRRLVSKCFYIRVNPLSSAYYVVFQKEEFFEYKQKMPGLNKYTDRFDTKIFDLYKSSELHTSKNIKTPSKIKYLIFLLVFVFVSLALVLYFFFSSDKSLVQKQQQQQQQQQQQLAIIEQKQVSNDKANSDDFFLSAFASSSSSALSTQVQKEKLIGCFSFNTKHCDCYKQNNIKIAISTDLCFELLSMPILPTYVDDI
jgi:zona occludens toxin (predicted ATPase)